MSDSGTGTAIDIAVSQGLAMVAIEMILTLGMQLGKGFDLRSYAATISDSGETAHEQEVRQKIAFVLSGISDSLG